MNQGKAMAIDLLFSFSVTKTDDENKIRELVEFLLDSDERIEMCFRHTRDRLLFTDRKIIAIDVQGITGSKKEFRVFPYSKISSFSVETAGTLDADADFNIWVSGVGIFAVKFSKKLNIYEVGKFLSAKVG
jgi:hypothetical protein